MGRLAVTFVVLFLSFLAFSWASEFPENDVSTEDLPSMLPESTDTILLPVESEDSADSKLPENEIRTVESNEEVTTVTFRPADHRLDGRPMMPVSFRFPFRHGRPCRHGRRPFKRSDLPARSREIPYGNDMILSTSEKLDSDSEGGLDPTRFHHGSHHHHHGKPELEEKGQMFQMKRQSDDDDLDHDMKRFRHGHRRFRREDGDEEEHDHHHHHRHHHHHHGDDEEEKSGFLMKFRKFLMDRF